MTSSSLRLLCPTQHAQHLHKETFKPTLLIEALIATSLLTPAAVFAQTTPADTALPAVNVTAEKTSDEGRTEGTNAYKAPAVTVGKVPTPQREIPASVSVVTRQRMDDQNMVTIEDALRNVTGVTAINYGDGTSYYQSRGYAAEAQFDGLPASTSLQYLPQFDLALYDRIEVLRGPAGILQGFGSPGGTVNFVRKRPLDTFGVNAAVMAGSWSNYRAEADVTTPVTEDGRVRARFGGAGFDRNFATDKEQERQGLVYGSVVFDITPSTSVTVGAAYQSNKQKGLDYGQSMYNNGTAYNAPRNQFYGTDWSFANIDISEVYGELAHDFGKGWQGTASASYRTMDSESKYGYINGVASLNNTARYTLQAQKDKYQWASVDAHAYGPFSLLGRTHQVLFGASYAERQQQSLSGSVNAGTVDIFNIKVPDQAIPYTGGTDSTTRQLGVYGQVTLKPVDALSVILGGRQNWYNSERTQTLPAGVKTEDPQIRKFTPYAGLVYEINKTLSAYASFSQIFTPPEAWQHGIDGKVLAPRTGKQFEIGIKGDFLDSRVTSSLAYFYIMDKNRAMSLTGFPGVWVAQGEAKSQGIEAELTGKILPNWDISAGYTYLQTRITNDPTSTGKSVDAEEPKHLLKLWTNYRFTTPALQNWRIGGGLRAQSRTTRNNILWQGGYGIADLQVGYRVNSNVDVTLSINNLFDRSYYARVPSNFYGLYGDPRSAMLAVRMKY